MSGWFSRGPAQPEEQADAAVAARTMESPAEQEQAAAGASTAPADDIWEVNKPVERRCTALNEEGTDCLGLFWRWVTCGGPGARISQLYVNGKLTRCMDEFTRLRQCMAGKLDADAGAVLMPGPHPLWRIRTRREAGSFWAEQYEHLGARRAAVLEEDEDGGRLGDISINQHAEAQQ